MTVENTAPAEVETHSVEVTDAAALKARALLDQEGRADMHLRIEVKPGGCAGLKYSLYFDHELICELPGEVHEVVGGDGTGNGDGHVG